MNAKFTHQGSEHEFPCYLRASEHHFFAETCKHKAYDIVLRVAHGDIISAPIDQYTFDEGDWKKCDVIPDILKKTPQEFTIYLFRWLFYTYLEMHAHFLTTHVAFSNEEKLFKNTTLGKQIIERDKMEKYITASIPNPVVQMITSYSHSFDPPHIQ